jgi:hypothetical protein
MQFLSDSSFRADSDQSLHKIITSTHTCNLMKTGGLAKVLNRTSHLKLLGPAIAPVPESVRPETRRHCEILHRRKHEETAEGILAN